MEENETGSMPWQVLVSSWCSAEQLVGNVNTSSKMVDLTGSRPLALRLQSAGP